MENQSFNFVFQITKKITFEVTYHRVGNNSNKYFSTSANVFNKPKSDYSQCGQCQYEVLTGKALKFYIQVEKFHLKDLSNEEYNHILILLEELKQTYNFIVNNNDSHFGFIACKELSNLPLKKSITMENQDKIPFGAIYSKYLNIASIRFNLTLDECRNKFGLYTEKQWLDLFNQPQNN